jgi:hypothetical protein
MEPRLIVYLVGVVALLAASVTAIADQSTKFVGAQDVPPFVRERVELTPGVAADRKTPADVAKPADSRRAS